MLKRNLPATLHNGAVSTSAFNHSNSWQTDHRVITTWIEKTVLEVEEVLFALCRTRQRNSTGKTVELWLTIWGFSFAGALIEQYKNVTTKGLERSKALCKNVNDLFVKMKDHYCNMTGHNIIKCTTMRSHSQVVGEYDWEKFLGWGLDCLSSEWGHVQCSSVLSRQFP